MKISERIEFEIEADVVFIIQDDVKCMTLTKEEFEEMIIEYGNKTGVHFE